MAEARARKYFCSNCGTVVYCVPWNVKCPECGNEDLEDESQAWRRARARTPAG